MSWLVMREVLRARRLLDSVQRHARFGPDLRSKGALFARMISSNWVVKEAHILIEIVFGLGAEETVLRAETPARCFVVLVGFIVKIYGSRRVFSSVEVLR